jgi:hypothetical protein
VHARPPARPPFNWRRALARRLSAFVGFSLNEHIDKNHFGSELRRCWPSPGALALLISPIANLNEVVIHRLLARYNQLCSQLENTTTAATIDELGAVPELAAAKQTNKSCNHKPGCRQPTLNDKPPPAAEPVASAIN